MVQAVDTWCLLHPDVEIFGQVATGLHRPTNFPFADYLTPDKYRQTFGEAKLIISHAGIGTILTAMTQSKRIVIMPRRADLKETRSDHQMATLRALKGHPGIYAARDEAELGPILNEVATRDNDSQLSAIPRFADPRLISAISNFIHSG
jgi:UDP-N-acetylglucosamine transferase subunit ALG13